jgi:hypothetical protein
MLQKIEGQKVHELWLQLAKQGHTLDKAARGVVTYLGQFL